MIKRLVPFFCFSVILCFLLIFTINSSAFSLRKPFWLDEVQAFRVSLEQQTYKDLLINGAGGQGSASPLDYLVAKGVYDLRTNLRYLNLQPHLYFRIQNLIYLWVTLLFILYIYIKQKSNKSLLLLTVSVSTFVFNASVMYFVSELRPYALWVDLSLLLLFITPLRDKTFYLWSFVIILISFTTTASIYQIGGLMLAEVVTRYASSGKLTKNIFINRDTFILLIGVVINLYYILHITSSGYPPPSWNTYLTFYLPFSPAIILGVFLSFYLLAHKKYADLTAVLGATIWFVFGPISFAMTIAKGFFFDPRQYIYYFPILTLFTYYLISNLVGDKRISVLKIILLILFVPTCLLIIRNTNVSFKAAVHLYLSGQPVSIPVNYQLLSARIPDNIPDKYHFENFTDSQNDLDTPKTNFAIYWQYLNEYYPMDRYLRQHATLTVRQREINVELVSIVNE